MRARIEPIPPSRGLILDRNGEPLALNRPAYQLELVREQTPEVVLVVNDQNPD